MQRHELEHLIRVAGAITGADEIIVIGSQAILGAFPDAPTSLLRSCEADVFTLRDPKDADLIDEETILLRIGTLPANETSSGELRERWLRIMKKA